VSADRQERQQLLSDIQAYLLGNYLMIPLPRSIQASVLAPRLANQPTEVIGAIPQYPFAGP
jgi:hypothetical protein